MSGHGDFCPLSRGAEIFATRWTPLVIRNMLLGCRTFSEIESGLPGISRTLLTSRLRMLEHHGVIERRTRPGRRGAEYLLTESGQSLAPVCIALARWGERWLELTPDAFDAGTVLWGLCHRLGDDDLPPRRTVVRFDVDGDKRYWLLLERPKPEVCSRPPGEHDDLVIATTPEWLTKWFLGRVSFGEALQARLMRAEGPRDLARRVGSWGGRGSYGEQPPQLVAV